MKSELEKAITEAKSKLTSEDTEVLKKAKEDFEAKMHKLSSTSIKMLLNRGRCKPKCTTTRTSSKIKIKMMWLMQSFLMSLKKTKRNKLTISKI